MVEIRRDIHRHPEIGRNEVRTSALIRKKLEEYGVDAIERPVPTAVVALIHGARGPGRCVALRCDIDALPVQEETGLPYTSENPGIMHACGHDMHASMMLGAAKILCGMRERFAGCVKLIFQHSEDTLPGGAKELVEKGVLENPHVDAIYGMHVLPDAHRASFSDQPGLTAFTIIPKLRKARTINPEKEPSAIRKESVQLAQTRTTEAKRMEPCTARGMLPQRFRQPGAADASITPSAKSPNMYGLGHARESSHRCRNRQNRPKA